MKFRYPVGRKPFSGSAAYWESRYQRGGTSGAGSYRHLAEFKAEVINGFMAKHSINSVIEFGCGDGNQLALMSYPKYIGLDVSKKAVALCKARFAEDRTKSFFLYDPFRFIDNHGVFTADMAISLDVIFHLIEDDIYQAYMSHLFSAAEQFVIIYSTNCEDISAFAPHAKHRKFSSWLSSHCANWSLIKKIPNRYPFEQGHNMMTSMSDFFIYQKI